MKIIRWIFNILGIFKPKVITKTDAILEQIVDKEYSQYEMDVLDGISQDADRKARGVITGFSTFLRK